MGKDGLVVLLDHRSKIAVEPVQRLLDILLRSSHVTVVEQHVTFLVGWASQQSKERKLVSLHRMNEIIAAVQHQHWNPHPRSKIKLIDFGRGCIAGESSLGERRRPDPDLLCECDQSHLASGADCEQTDALSIDIGAGCEVVEGPPQVLDLLDLQVPIPAGPALRATPFISSLINREQNRSTAPHQKIETPDFRLVNFGQSASGAGRSINYGLKGRLGILRQV